MKLSDRVPTIAPLTPGWRGCPQTVGSSARGASSPAKPDLTVALPLSMTTTLRCSLAAFILPTVALKQEHMSSVQRRVTHASAFISKDVKRRERFLRKNTDSGWTLHSSGRAGFVRAPLLRLGV